MLTYQRGSNNKHLAINFAICKEDKIEELIKEFTFQVLKISKKIKYNRLKNIFEKQFYPQLFKFILKTLFKKISYTNYYIEIEGKIITDVDEEFERIRGKKGKENELKALQDVIEKERNKHEYIVGHRIKFRDQNLHDLAEFDGIVYLIKEKEFRILFLEAKGEKKGGKSKAKKQLKKSLSKLHFSVDENEIQTNSYYAYYIKDISG